jgi:hypothetical protein
LLTLFFFVWIVPGFFLGGIPALLLIIVNIFVMAFNGTL